MCKGLLELSDDGNIARVFKVLALYVVLYAEDGLALNYTIGLEYHKNTVQTQKRRGKVEIGLLAKA